MERSPRFSFRRKDSKKKLQCLPEKISHVNFCTARQIYSELTTEYRLKTEQLVEVIGFLCASLFAKIYPESCLHKDKTCVLVCCGTGVSGVEGLVCARHLKLFGYRPTIFYPHTPSNALEKAVKEQCERLVIPFLFYLPSEAQLLTDSYSLIIDCIHGFEYQDPLPTESKNFIQTIIRSKLPVVSINIPSGWDDMNHPSIHQSSSQPSTPTNLPAPTAHEQSHLQPETLISTFVPLDCSKHFKGRHHFLLGHLLLPPDLLQRYNLTLPGTRDSDNSIFDMSSILPSTSHETYSRVVSHKIDEVKIEDFSF